MRALLPSRAAARAALREADDARGAAGGGDRAQGAEMDRAVSRGAADPDPDGVAARALARRSAAPLRRLPEDPFRGARGAVQHGRSRRCRIAGGGGPARVRLDVHARPPIRDDSLLSRDDRILLWSPLPHQPGGGFRTLATPAALEVRSAGLLLRPARRLLFALERLWRLGRRQPVGQF